MGGFFKTDSNYYECIHIKHKARETREENNLFFIFNVYAFLEGKVLEEVIESTVP